MATIIFKHGATSPAQTNGAGFIGEPLFYYDLQNHIGELYVGMGKSGGSGLTANETDAYPVKIGGHPTVTLTNGTNTTAIDQPQQGEVRSITSTSGYAISSLEFDADGHVTKANAIQLPAAYTHPTVTVTAGQNITSNNGTYTANANYAIGGMTIDSTGHVTGITAVSLPTVTVTQVLSSGTVVAKINGIDIYAPTAGQSVSSELTAQENNSQTPNGKIDMKTDNGNNLVTLQSDANNTNTTISYSVAASGNNKIVSASVVVNEINGGTW